MAYSPPAGNDVDLNFTAGSYSAPTGSDVDFNFTDAGGSTNLIDGRLVQSILLKGLVR